jgi:hypothetical protein
MYTQRVAHAQMPLMPSWNVANYHTVPVMFMAHGMLVQVGHPSTANFNLPTICNHHCIKIQLSQLVHACACTLSALAAQERTF